MPSRGLSDPVQKKTEQEVLNNKNKQIWGYLKIRHSSEVGRPPTKTGSSREKTLKKKWGLGS